MVLLVVSRLVLVVCFVLAIVWVPSTKWTLKISLDKQQTLAVRRYLKDSIPPLTKTRRGYGY